MPGLPWWIPPPAQKAITNSWNQDPIVRELTNAADAPAELPPGMTPPAPRNPFTQDYPLPNPDQSDFHRLGMQNPGMGTTFDPSGYDVPGGFDPDKSVHGTMDLGELNLHNGQALNGLRAAASQIPELARIDNAFDIRSTGRPQDLRYSAGIMQDANASLAPQRAEMAKIQDALTGNHPAISASEEGEARRKSYPAEAAAQGNIMASMIGSKGRIEASQNQMRGNQARAGAQSLQGVLRGLVDAMQDRVTDSSDPQAKNKRMATWLALLSQLQSGGLVPELNDDDYDTDTGY